MPQSVSDVDLGHEDQEICGSFHAEVEADLRVSIIERYGHVVSGHRVPLRLQQHKTVLYHRPEPDFELVGGLTLPTASKREVSK